MKRKSLQLAAACTAALGLTVRASAAELPESHGSILVTATRYPVPQDQLLPATIVIEREELERSLATDIADVLRFRSGLEFGRNGGMGQSASLFLRGTESNHTLVLIDGVRVNPGTVGGAALQNISPELVQRIEIVKGPRSTLYGTDAIGGVIQIFTNAASSEGLATQASYGAYDTMSSNLSAGLATQDSHFGFGVNYQQTDGFAPRTNDPRGGAYDNLTFNLSGNTDLSLGTLSANYWRSAGSSDYVSFSSRTPGNALMTQDFVNETAYLAYEFTQGIWRTTFELGRMVDDLEQQRVRDALGAFESDDFATTRRNSVGWQNDFDLGEINHLGFGVSYYDEEALTLSFGEVDVDAVQAYVQDCVTIGRHTLLGAVGYIDHEAFEDHVTWTAEYGLMVTPATRLSASAGTAFRAPDATDRFGFGGNANLAPEESLSYELGLRHRISERQQIYASGFDNRIDQLIEYVVTDPLTFDGELRNAQRARIRGIEAGYEIHGDSWQLRTEALYQEPENLVTGDKLLRRAERNFNVGYLQQLGAVEVGLEVLAAGEREDFGGVKLDSYVLTNLTARYAFNSHWSAQARVENALDEDYVLASGYNTLGRSLFVSLRYTPR